MATEPREFQVRLLDWREVHDLPDSWRLERLRTLLGLLDLDGISDDEARDMALMALQDLEPDEAGDKVLEAVFGPDMKPGVRRNLAHDLEGDRPWEEFADITRQAGIFEAVVLLQEALPRAFDKPDAAKVTVSVTTASGKGLAWLDEDPVDPALLLRLLAPAMGGAAVLNRLFDESLAGPRFPESAGILWRIARRAPGDRVREFDLISSRQWFDPLEGGDAWTVEARPDEEPEDPGD